jgi:LuxR family maltose regulon positive regulatory protein
MAWKIPMASEGVLHMPLDAITITIGSAAWYTWLADATHCSFHFSHPSSDFTARKERKQRGLHYRIAYRHAHGKLYKAYLGKHDVLTEDSFAQLRTHSHVLSTLRVKAQPSSIHAP